MACSSLDMPASMSWNQVRFCSLVNIVMVVLPSQSRVKTIFRKEMEEEKNLYCLHAEKQCLQVFCGTAQFIACVISFFFPMCFSQQLKLKIFCMCPYCKPSYFSRLEIQCSGETFYFFSKGQAHQYSSYSLSRPMETVRLRLNRPE